MGLRFLALVPSKLSATSAVGALGFADLAPRTATSRTLQEHSHKNTQNHVLRNLGGLGFRVFIFPAKVRPWSCKKSPDRHHRIESLKFHALGMASTNKLPLALRGEMAK